MQAKTRAIGKSFDRFLAGKPELSFQDAESSARLKVRNFGCLLQKLLAKGWGEEAKQYRVLAENYATENMSAVVEYL